MAIIDKPTDYFNTVLWSGNATNRDITGVGFQPDFTWIKNRSAGYSHVLGNSLSGDNKFLSSNSTSAESTDSDKFRTFVSDGIQVGTHNGVNASGSNYVGWNWKAGGTASSNTDGSITSNVSANTTSGFSIVNFTKTDGEVTVGHGLNAKPSLIIFKPLASANWIVTPEISGSMSNNYLLLHNTDALATDGAFSNPTTSVFSISNNIAPNSEHIAYCFANKQGYSKFGSYTGNGNDDGTFVYTGFKPAWIMVKCSSITSTFTSWSMFDTSRSPYNVSVGNTLYANKSINEGYRGNGSSTSTTSPAMDLLSNGFKFRKNADETNTSGETYIYMAFAENPFVTSTGVCATAR